MMFNIMAPVWKQLAPHMKDKPMIMEVNCDDNASLCKSLSIGGYPTLIYFDKDGVKSEYQGRSGGRKLDQLKVFLVANVGVHMLDNQHDLESLVAKEDVLVYLLLHSPQDTKILVWSGLVWSFDLKGPRPRLRPDNRSSQA